MVARYERESVPVKQTERSIVTRELQKAQSSLTRAQSMAAYVGDHRLSKKLRDQGVALGETIVELQGAQPKLTAAEIMPA